VPTSSEAGVADTLVRLPDVVDLHARPAANFVRAAMRFSADISVTVAERTVDAKSLLSVLALGARRGSELRLHAEGDDAAAALDALTGTVAGLTD
jgi:phosphotransferase system HPr (HPr) family protein